MKQVLYEIVTFLQRGSTFNSSLYFNRVYSVGPIFVADARRDGNHRFIVRADEELTVFLNLEPARGGRAHQELAISWPDQCSRSQPRKFR
jgi:hypothetical protein